MASQSERSDARLNRERLLAAAREVLAERGEAAEMREIAERAGVAVGTLYRHFPTREALVSAIIAETLEEVRGIIAEAEANPYAIDALRHLVARACGLAERGRGIFELITGMELGVRVPDDLIPAELKRELEARVTRIVARGVERGEIRSDFPPPLLAAFCRATIPFVFLHLRQEWPFEDAVRASVALLTDALRPH
ncbi:putative HTH-type transcriptional regulator YvdT [bacterium HR29]|jgi:AcrR family transcriptional regulator|nr:putative HTH-type transcriptional regulator YvdT [bacterium HR29]